MSLARALFRKCAAPQLLQAFVDDRVLIEYEHGDVRKQFYGIVRDTRTVLLQDEDGSLNKQTIGSLVMLTEECHVLGGVSDPQVKATFIITDDCGNESRWSVFSDENTPAIQSRDDTFVVVNIKQTRTAARATQTYRT